jgi:hypothetical protein
MNTDNPYRSPTSQDAIDLPRQDVRVAYHDLVIIGSSVTAIGSLAEKWASGKGFVLRPTGDDRFLILDYVGWHGFGITDAQTGTIMELRIADVGAARSAVAIFHHTKRILWFVGFMMGKRLQTEVESLVSFLHTNG